MARKRRLPYDCFSCGKRFKSAQAVRGHRRHCRYPRLRRQADAQAKSQPRATTETRKRPGFLSQEAKLLLLDAQEGLEELRRDAHDFAMKAQILAGMNTPREREKMQAWSSMYQTLDDCLQELAPMIPLFRLDRISLLTLYTRLRHLKELWMQQRVCGFQFASLEPDGLDEEARTALGAEAAQFARLIDQVKRLVAAAP